MDFRNFNDYEIIDMIRQGDEEALKLMFDKYKYLVAKKIVKFNLTDEYDDCFQEGMIVLYRSVRKFDDSRNKSFTRFFETNLEHHFISTIRSRSRRAAFLREKSHKLVEFEVAETDEAACTETEIREAMATFSEFEKQVFDARFIREKEIRTIGQDLGVPAKKVYNAIDRIRQKIKMRLP